MKKFTRNLKIDNPIEDIYPISPMQGGMLFYSQLNPSAQLYHEQLLCKVTGMVNVNAFKEAWRIIVNENAILRTVFDWDGEPIQIVLNNLPLRFDYEDIRKLEGKDKYIERDNRAELNKNFDLEKGPLIRFKLLRIDENYHIFRISYHHIILDGGSLPILFRDFEQYYDDLIIEVKPQARLRHTYKEYIQWLLDQNVDAARRYWKQFLHGYKIDNSIFINGSIFDLTNRSVHVKKITISKENTDKLSILSRRVHITVNNILQSLWALLLYKKTGLKDLIYGLTVSGRPIDIDNSEKMVGLFINTVPMRVRINENDSLLSLSKQIQTNWANMQEFTFIPLSKIKRLMGMKTAGDPFQSIFVYSDKSIFGDINNNSPLAFELYSSRELTNYLYTIDVTFDEELVFQISYPPEYLSDRDINDIVNEYVLLFEKFINFPDESLKTVLNIINIRSIAIKQKGIDINFSEEIKNPKLNLVQKSVQKDLKEVWEDVLGVNDISICDNFFELGGDSISSLRIVSKLVQRNYALTIKEFFENPTILLLSKVITKNNKLIQDNFKYKPSTTMENLILKNHLGNVEKIIPLSYVQESILKECHENKSSLYHDQSYFEYGGEINYELFEEAWNYLIANNSILRSVFYFDKKGSAQCILKEFKLKLKLINIEGLDNNKQRHFIESYKNEDLQNKFDLEIDPPLRITLIRLSEKKHIFFFSFNVILLDGWCFAFVLSDFYNYYKTLISKKSVHPILREPYESYVYWVLRQDRNKALSYWKNYLINFSPKLYVKRNIEKKNLVRYDVGAIKIKLSNKLLNKLEKISMKGHFTLNAIFQTLWAYTLHILSSNEDVIIGVTVAGRPPALKGSDNIIGTFFNDIPVRFKFSKNRKLVDIIKNSQKEFNTSRDFEFITNQQIKKQLKLNEREELFQTLFIFENYPRSEEKFLRSKDKELLNEVRNWRRESSAIDLNIYVETAILSSIEIRYLKNIFDEEVIRKILIIFRENLAKFAEQDI